MVFGEPSMPHKGSHTPLYLLLDVIIFGSFFQVRSITNMLTLGTWKAMPVDFLAQGSAYP